MATIKQLLFEAYRRNQMADGVERSKPLTRRWLGLGTEAAYRPVLRAGLMQFHDGQIPPPRCMGWLRLTVAGAAVLKHIEPECQTKLSSLNANPRYQSSHVAHYHLAGGLTA